MGRLGGRVLEVMGDDPEDLVISNMAPKSEWCKVGEAAACHLCELALDLASRERAACAGVPIRVLRGAGFDPRHGQALAASTRGRGTGHCHHEIVPVGNACSPTVSGESPGNESCKGLQCEPAPGFPGVVA